MTGPLSKLDVLFVLVTKELRVRYKSSLLGYFWALANPFAFALVYYVAFKFIMRVNIDNYAVFLLSALFPWVWVSSAITQATTSYRDNASLVKRVNLWRGLIPLSNVLHTMVHFFFSLPALFLFMLYDGAGLYWSWLYQLPVLFVLQLLMIYPLALIFALINVFIHDIEYLVGIGFSMLFFLTPIVYSLDMIPAPYNLYFRASPLTQLMESWRGVFLEGTLPLFSILYCGVFAALAGLLATYAYGKLQAKIGEQL